MPVFTNYAGELAAKLDEYRTKGQKEAAAHRPPTDASRMDQHEAALNSDAEKWVATEQRLFDALLTDTSRAVAEAEQKAIALQNNIEQLLSDESLLTTIETDMAEERGRLVSATEKRMRAEVDWRDLRVSNNISVQAVYPDSRIFHFAIIAVLALIETVINAFFYENSEGLLGGFFVALSVSLINMGGAVTLGWGFRYKNLSKIDSKLIGWGSLLLFVVFAVYCNAVFAAFRSEYQLLADPTDTLQMRKGFALALANAGSIFLLRMQIADLSSFVLFGLGIFLSGLAFYKGYTLDDKFPGYGTLDRLVKECRRVEAELQELLRQRIKDSLHHRRADVQSALHEPTLVIGLATRRTAELETAVTSLCNHAATIQRDFDMVLSAYRNANAAVRATDPPAYFKEAVDVTTRVDSSASIAFVRRIERLQAMIQSFRDKYQERLNEKLHRLQTDSASVLNNNFFVFVKGVEAEAHERINRTVTVIHREPIGAANA